MQLDADPRCTRGTSSEPVLTLRTGRKDCELCVIYLRAVAQLPLFYTLAGFRLSRRGRRRQLKSGKNLDFLHRWRRHLRHHRLHRHHGQHPAPPRAARRAAARAGCRSQVKIYMPYVVRAGGLALLTTKKPLAGAALSALWSAGFGVRLPVAARRGDRLVPPSLGVQAARVEGFVAVSVSSPPPVARRASRPHASPACPQPLPAHPLLPPLSPSPPLVFGSFFAF